MKTGRGGGARGVARPGCAEFTERTDGVGTAGSATCRPSAVTGLLGGCRAWGGTESERWSKGRSFCSFTGRIYECLKSESVPAVRTKYRVPSGSRATEVCFSRSWGLQVQGRRAG